MNRTGKLLVLAGALLLIAVVVYGFNFMGRGESNRLHSIDPGKAEMIRSIRSAPRAGTPPKPGGPMHDEAAK